MLRQAHEALYGTYTAHAAAFESFQRHTRATDFGRHSAFQRLSLSEQHRVRQSITCYGDLAVLRIVAQSWRLAYLAHGAVQSGSIDKVKWISKFDKDDDTLRRIARAAGFFNNEPVLEWLETVCRWPRPEQIERRRRSFRGALEGGHADLAQQLCSQYNLGNDSRALLSAAYGGSLPSVPWLLAEDARPLHLAWDDWLGEVLDYDSRSEPYVPGQVAAYAGRINVLEFMQQQGVQFDHQVMTGAVRGRQLNTIEWLTEHECLPTEHNLVQAFKPGDIAVAKLLADICAPSNAQNLSSSCIRVRNGVTQSVEMLQYLTDLGVKWTSKEYTLMLHHCTEERCLQSAQWARRRGAQWPRIIYCSKQQRAKVWGGRWCYDQDPVWPEEIRAWALSVGCDTIVG